MESLHLRVYADASFATSEDMSLQIGYIILLCDDTNLYNVLNFSNRKSQRVVQSIMGGELWAFTDAFGAVAMIALDIAGAFQMKIPVPMFTDYRQVFGVITRSKRPTERCLAIAMQAAREAYQSADIDGVGLVRGDKNPAEALRKLNHNVLLNKLFSPEKMIFQLNNGYYAQRNLIRAKIQWKNEELQVKKIRGSVRVPVYKQGRVQLYRTMSVLFFHLAHRNLHGVHKNQ